jgi:hypothetical protein
VPWLEPEALDDPGSQRAQRLKWLEARTVIGDARRVAETGLDSTSGVSHDQMPEVKCLLDPAALNADERDGRLRHRA